MYLRLRIVADECPSQRGMGTPIDCRLFSHGSVIPDNRSHSLPVYIDATLGPQCDARNEWRQLEGQVTARVILLEVLANRQIGRLADRLHAIGTSRYPLLYQSADAKPSRVFCFRLGRVAPESMSYRYLP